VDTSKVAVAGMSCGGLEAYDFARDQRVSTIGIFNSGYLDANKANFEAPQITKPIFFFMGGPSDIAFGNVSALLSTALCLREMAYELVRASVTTT
jgi:dienelactone hydrolase